jgi:hypothetical protein
MKIRLVMAEASSARREKMRTASLAYILLVPYAKRCEANRPYRRSWVLSEYISSRAGLPEYDRAPRALVSPADSVKIPNNMDHFAPPYLECGLWEPRPFDIGQSTETGTSTLDEIRAHDIRK